MSKQSKQIALAVLVAAGTLTVAACGSSLGATTSAGDVAHGTNVAAHHAKKPAPQKKAVTLMTAKTKLGTIVVDGHGRTLYAYDADRKGTAHSACTAGCLGLWPPADVKGKITEHGVTGTVKTIAAPGGGRQLTLNGWPLYYYAGDSGRGQTNGQGVDGIWWVMTPAGSKVTGASGSSAGGGTGGDTGW